MSVLAARGLVTDDIRRAIQITIPIPANVQHDPELASRGSVASGGDDQTKFFGKRVAKAASRSTKGNGRGMELRLCFPVNPNRLRLHCVGREEAVSDAKVRLRHLSTGH